MMPGADGDARIVQYGGGVVGMHPIDVEADDPGGVFRSVERDSTDTAQCVAALRDQSAFVRVDRTERKLLDPIHRRVEPDRTDDVRCSRLEPSRRVKEGRLLECDL